MSKDPVSDGTSPEIVETMARILHDHAIGCESHYRPYRAEDGFSVERVHSIQAETLLRAIKREMARDRGAFAALAEPTPEPES
jgi:hypothetical protein